MRKEIKRCALFLPLISANTDARSDRYFRREWNLAEGSERGCVRRSGARE